jgi:MFS transporter, MHS family, shikimate and dehydroshikimate transport protein
MEHPVEKRHIEAEVPPGDMRSIRPVILASFIGTTIEWYDFFLYGTAAALVFGRLFFPNVDPLVGTLSAFGTFAVGFVARPLGGIVFGHYGDRVGRKSMLIYSLVIMGVATFLIGVLPTYTSIGVWAPILLVVLRCGQGIGVGGEWGGAVLMAVEHSPKHRRGLSGSWPQMGVPAGLFLSTVVFGLFSTRLTDAQFLSWGWRVPFLLSAALVVVGLFIRLRLLETPAFTTLQQSGRRETRPLMTAVRDYRRNMLLAMGMRVAENGLFYVYTVFVLTYGPARLGLSRGTMLWGVTLAALAGLAAIPLYGALSDRIGRRPVYLFGASFSLAYALPFFWLLDMKSPVIAGLAIVLGVVFGHNAMYGPQAAYFSELFGSSVRYSGASVSYQLSSVVTGGLAPFIATALLASWGSNAVAAYMMLLAAITIVATYIAPETYRADIST